MREFPWANWNGQQMPLGEVRVSVLDRAFLFGDAVYEAMRLYSGRLFLESRHLQRLKRSLSVVRIDCDVDRLARRLHETLDVADVQEGFVYIQVTRGEAPRAHRFPDPPVSPNELISITPLDEGSVRSLAGTGRLSRDDARSPVATVRRQIGQPARQLPGGPGSRRSGNGRGDPRGGGRNGHGRLAYQLLRRPRRTDPDGPPWKRTSFRESLAACSVNWPSVPVFRFTRSRSRRRPCRKWTSCFSRERRRPSCLSRG